MIKNKQFFITEMVEVVYRALGVGSGSIPSWVETMIEA